MKDKISLSLEAYRISVKYPININFNREEAKSQMYIKMGRKNKYLK